MEMKIFMGDENIIYVAPISHLRSVFPLISFLSMIVNLLLQASPILRMK